MSGSQWHSDSTALDDATLGEGAQTALIDQLTADVSGRRLAEILEELTVAGAAIEAALLEAPRSANTPVLCELLGAVRLGESLVMETWNSLHA